MTVRAQPDDLGRMVRSIVRQSSDVVWFEVRRTVSPQKRSVGLATLATSVSTAQHVQSNCLRPCSVEANGGASRYGWSGSEQRDPTQFVDIGGLECLCGKVRHASSPPIRDERSNLQSNLRLGSRDAAWISRPSQLRNLSLNRRERDRRCDQTDVADDCAVAIGPVTSGPRQRAYPTGCEETVPPRYR